MNKNLKAIIQAATRKCSETRGVYDELLAELIIEQCAQLVDEARDTTGEQLKRHFGMAPPMGYSEEELDRDNPHNQWMNHAQ